MADIVLSPEIVFGNQLSRSDQGTIRAAAILTLAYVASSWVDARKANWVEVVLAFTVGASSGAQFKLESSDDQATIATHAEYDAATATWAAVEPKLSAATQTVAIRFQKTARYWRISAKALVDETGTSLTIKAISYYE